MLDSFPDELQEPYSDVPDDFTGSVRDALSHLYDYAHLQRHPLAKLATAAAGIPLDSSKALRNLLLDTVEQLNPGEGVSPNDKEWRPYGILTRRYVDGFTVEDIMEELHVSLRQFQREHRKGLLAVANMLWQRWQRNGTGIVPNLAENAPAQAEDATPGGDLRQEVESLGLLPERLDLATLVQSVAGLCASLAGEWGVELRIPAKPEATWAWTDATLGRQALLAALSVLIAARPARIAITYDRGAGQPAIELRPVPPPRDSVPGGSAERQERLAAVAGLMRAQGGDLRQVLADHRLQALQLRFAEAAGARVLLVDDNERVLQLFDRYLSAEGYLVTSVSGGREALEAARREPPQVIVLDVMMRGMDGWQLLQRLRADPSLRDVPVIVCSVLNEPELATALGAQCLLKKPVSQQDMLAAVKSVLARDYAV